MMKKTPWNMSAVGWTISCGRSGKEHRPEVGDLIWWNVDINTQMQSTIKCFKRLITRQLLKAWPLHPQPLTSLKQNNWIIKLGSELILKRIRIKASPQPPTNLKVLRFFSEKLRRTIGSLFWKTQIWTAFVINPLLSLLPKKCLACFCLCSWCSGKKCCSCCMVGKKTRL